MKGDMLATTLLKVPVLPSHIGTFIWYFLKFGEKIYLLSATCAVNLSYGNKQLNESRGSVEEMTRLILSLETKPGFHTEAIVSGDTDSSELAAYGNFFYFVCQISVLQENFHTDASLIKCFAQKVQGKVCLLPLP